jgi:outer membrane lipoprotein carrier protein
MFTSHIVLFLSLMHGDAAAADSSQAPVVADVQVQSVTVKKPSKVSRPAPVAPLPTTTPAPAPSLLTEIVPASALSLPVLSLSLPMTTMQVAVAPTASDVVAKVQNFYTATKSFTASFQQTVTNQTFNKVKPKVSLGKVYILKPGKMRWDYKNESYRTSADPKVSKSFISDGKHLWAVMHKNKQYYKEDLSGSTLPVALSFLMGTGNLTKEFDVALDTPGKYGSKSDILLLLTPKQPSARYKKLWLVVDSKNFSVKQSIVLNTKGDTNAIRFSSVKTNDGSLKSGHFIFNAKANKGFRLISPPSSPTP